jgi:predicted Zn-dependent protease
MLMRRLLESDCTSAATTSTSRSSSSKKPGESSISSTTSSGEAEAAAQLLALLPATAQSVELAQGALRQLKRSQVSSLTQISTSL